MVLDHNRTRFRDSTGAELCSVAIRHLPAPFKKSILLLCKKGANLLLVDKVFTLLIEDLRRSESPVAEKLLKELKKEILKRRSILSSVLEVLHDLSHKFELEGMIGQRKPSDEEMIEVLTQVLDAEVDRNPSESPETEEPPVSCASYIHLHQI